MELLEFNKQLNSARLRKTMQRGAYITCRYEAPSYIYLYTLGNFYVEIWHVTTFGSQAWCRGFNALDQLEPYLQKINLEQLKGRENKK